jgi:hypothetical protein
VEYPCTYWGDHIHDARKEDMENQNRQLASVVAFLKRYFLHWFEALRLLHEVAAGISLRGPVNNIESGGSR